MRENNPMSLDRIRRRWRALFRRNEMERELEAELRFHLERDTAENLGRGMSAEEARFAALRSFGGVDQSREECRDARGVRLLQEFWWDLRFGLRMLLKQPGFTCVAVVTLALGIGANTAIFSVVNSVLLRQLPFKSPDQLMWVWSSRTDKDNAPFSLPDFLDYRDQNQTLEQIAAFSNIGLSLTGIERTERLQGLRVSANLFQLLGVDASAGRVLIPEDDQPARRHVVVLSHECWQRRFGSDPQMVGKPLKLNGESYEIVGILPQQFDLPIREAEVAIPLAPEVDPLRNVRASVNFLRAVARLKPGVTRQQAQADLTAVVLRERQQFGEAYLKKTAAGLMVAAWGVRFLLALSPTQLPREQEIGIDLKVLAFAVVASVGAAVIFGILPALHGARSEMIGGLRAGGRGAGEGARRNRS
ncbi:MAG TPA: ABC transporter permease, partial [Pyrinomonadaceae bacterium]|nr:ABC transporter permease [Pyrinomonadaceae bacterium]